MKRKKGCFKQMVDDEKNGRTWGIKESPWWMHLTSMESRQWLVPFIWQFSIFSFSPCLFHAMLWQISSVKFGHWYWECTFTNNYKQKCCKKCMHMWCKYIYIIYRYKHVDVVYLKNCIIYFNVCKRKKYTVGVPLLSHFYRIIVRIKMSLYQKWMTNELPDVVRLSGNKVRTQQGPVVMRKRHSLLNCNDSY